MAGDPEGVVRFEAGDARYQAMFGFRAMKEVERHFELPFMEAMQEAMPSLSPADAADKAKVEAAARKVRVGDIGTLFGFALVKYHPALTETQVDDLIDEIGLDRAGEILAEALTAALVKEGDDGSQAGPQPRRPKR
ncbi:MAG: hypothetical protein AB7O91_04105 [Sphingomonas sp.]